MDREFRDRIDGHMARGNEIMDRVEAEMRLTREQHADHMQETREARRGYRVAINEVLREGRKNREAFEENREVVRETREVIRENREAMRDMREASEAHTKAIWALLDRIDNGGASPATG